MYCAMSVLSFLSVPSSFLMSLHNRCGGKQRDLVPQRGNDVSVWPQMLIHPSHESTAKHLGLLLRHPQVAAGRENELSCSIIQLVGLQALQE